MADHDPLCPAGIGVNYVVSSFPIHCACDVIAKTRADERQKIAAAIERARTDWIEEWRTAVVIAGHPEVRMAYSTAARIARYGGSDGP